MVAFYNAADQELYKKYKFLPQEKYRLGLTLPTDPEPVAPVPGGITNTNAFNNSGGNNFNPTGNAFGYGSPVSEVNVRTFNPQSNDPTGSVANAQTMYNKASNAGPTVETFSRMRPSQEVMDYYGEQIMNNKEQYGAQGQYNSPYEDSMDLGYQGTLGNNEMYPSEKYPNSFMKGKLNRFKNKVGDVAKFAGGLLPFPLNMATKFLPQGDDNGPSGGTYGIAGLSDDKKAAYNALAGENMLFGGEQGFKTLTGKNFQATNYVPNQLEIYEKLKDEEELTGFQKKQLQEASAVYKATQKQNKDAADAAAKDAEIAAAAQAAKYYTPTGTSGGGAGQGIDISNAGNIRSSDNNFQGDSGPTTQQESDYGYGSDFGFAKGGRAGYFFGGRVNYKKGGRGRTDAESQYGADSVGSYDSSQNKSGRQQSYGGDNSNNLVPTVDVNKKINEKINERLTGMIPDRVDKSQLLSDNAKRYQILSKNRNIPFFMNRSNGPKTINKNLYTNNLTDLNLQYPDIEIEDKYGMIDGDKAKSLIDQAVLKQTISPVEGLNLTRSIDTTGTQSNTSGDYTMGNFNFSSPNIEEGILNTGVNYDLGDLNLRANLNTNDSTINDSKLGFNYGDGVLTGSTFRDNDYGYTTNKLGVDKTFDVGNNFKVGLDGSYQEDKFKDGSYYNADLTPSLTYNDGTFNANLSKEIVEGGTQPNLGIGFQKNGFYANANNLLSQDPTGTIGYQKNIGSPDGPLQFSAGGEMDPFTGQKTAGLYGKYTFKNGGLAGLL